MSNHKLLAALCYFSVFFALYLLPVIIYFVTDDSEVKHHAKRSLVSHLVPVVLLIAGFIIFSFSMFSSHRRLKDCLVKRMALAFGTGHLSIHPHLWTAFSRHSHLECLSRCQSIKMNV